MLNFKGCKYVALQNSAIECAALSIANGVIEFEMDADDMAPYDHGATATYSCNEGFHLNGVSTRTCGDGTGTMGSWSGSAPSCDGKFF